MPDFGEADFFEGYIYSLKRGLDQIDWRKLEEACKRIRACTGTVWLIGNGGSASLASHMATDLQLAGVRAQSLTDVSAITTYANDWEFEACFKAQLQVMSKPEDILIAISGSGNSMNLLLACEWARAIGPSYVIGVSGFDGGELKNVCDLHLHAPVHHMGRAQDLEQIMLHIICYWLMEKRKV